MIGNCEHHVDVRRTDVARRLVSRRRELDRIRLDLGRARRPAGPWTYSAAHARPLPRAYPTTRTRPPAASGRLGTSTRRTGCWSGHRRRGWRRDHRPWWRKAFGHDGRHGAPHDPRRWNWYHRQRRARNASHVPETFNRSPGTAAAAPTPGAGANAHRALVDRAERRDCGRPEEQ